jgi:TIR domain/Caspase domain
MHAMDNSHALVVGIANYQHINKLPQTVLKDAQAIYDVLIDPECCGYQLGNTRLLLDGQATQAVLRQALADLAQHSHPDSTVFFYISSHGGRIESGPFTGEYLLPVDAVYTSDASLAQSAISGAEFTAALRAIPARKVVVVFDCCHAGGIGQPKDAGAPSIKTGLPEHYYATLTSGRGRVILASSRDSEYSYVLPGAENSLFTHHLLAGLGGGAPGPGGVIRIFDLFHFLQPKFIADQPLQHPVFKAEVEENFPVALCLGGKAPAPPLRALPADDFTYDVFISYRQREPDRTWVRQTLLPRLKAEGMRVCIDYESFRLGAPLVREIERAVEQSRYTLAVLSPAYLASNFTELENILAEHLGLEKTQRRLLAVMREDCTPRLGMRARLWLDMTADGEFDANIARLVYELRQSPNT